MTGLPHHSGRSRSSTAKKNASMSTWRIEATPGKICCSTGPCLARKRASSGMPLAYAFHFLFARDSVRLKAFGGEDAGDAGEVVGYADVGPVCCVEEGLHGGQGIGAQLEDEECAGLQMRYRLGD